jgi:hypothetical protein
MIGIGAVGVEREDSGLRLVEASTESGRSCVVQLPDEIDGFVGACASISKPHVQGGELGSLPADANAENHPPWGEAFERGDLLGE